MNSLMLHRRPLSWRGRKRRMLLLAGMLQGCRYENRFEITVLLWRRKRALTVSSFPLFLWGYATTVVQCLRWCWWKGSIRLSRLLYWLDATFAVTSTSATLTLAALSRNIRFLWQNWLLSWQRWLPRQCISIINNKHQCISMFFRCWSTRFLNIFLCIFMKQWWIVMLVLFTVRCQQQLSFFL